MRELYFLVVIAVSQLLHQTDATSTWMLLFNKDSHCTRYRPFDRTCSSVIHNSFWGRRKQVRYSLSALPRGGSSSDNNTEEEEEEDDDDDRDVEEGNDEADTNRNINEEKAVDVDIQQKVLEDSSNEEVDEEEEGDNDGIEDESNESGSDDEINGVQIEMNVNKYDEPYVASPMTSMYVSLGVMVLGRKVDLLSPTMVRIARFVFIAYIILHQCFLFYVRIQAKSINDRTPIQLTNPLSSLIQNQLLGGSSEEGGGANNMIKSLASSFLSSQSTVLDYDLKQARGMQSGLIFNMLFMWFLHFKMGQVQPLLIQSLNGVTAMVYSPLFQIYVLGRNLERPFKINVPKPKIEEESAHHNEDDTEADGDDNESVDDKLVDDIDDVDDSDGKEEDTEIDTEQVEDDE
jgi:Phosphate transport (Pho88)